MNTYLGRTVHVLAVLVISVGLAIGLGKLMERGSDNRLRKDCSELDVDMAVWEACYPQVGCMGTYQDALALTKKLAQCKDFLDAP